MQAVAVGPVMLWKAKLIPNFTASGDRPRNLSHTQNLLSGAMTLVKNPVAADACFSAFAPGPWFPSYSGFPPTHHPPPG